MLKAVSVFAYVCLLFVRVLKGKQLDLSILKSVEIKSIAGHRVICNSGQNSKEG